MPKKVSYLKLCRELWRLRREPNWLLGASTAAKTPSLAYRTDDTLILMRGVSPAKLAQVSIMVMGEGFKKEEIIQKDGIMLWQGGLISNEYGEQTKSHHPTGQRQSQERGSRSTEPLGSGVLPLRPGVRDDE